MKHVVENRRVRYRGNVVMAEAYILDGVPIEVFIDGIDEPIDAKLVEFLGDDDEVRKSD